MWALYTEKNDTKGLTGVEYNTHGCNLMYLQKTSSAYRYQMMHCSALCVKFNSVFCNSACRAECDSVCDFDICIFYAIAQELQKK